MHVSNLNQGIPSSAGPGPTKRGKRSQYRRVSQVRSGKNVRNNSSKQKNLCSCKKVLQLVLL